MVALELTIKNELCTEIRRSNAKLAIGELAVISVVHRFARHTVIKIMPGLVKKHISPLHKCFTHLLLECTKCNITHRRWNCTLTGAIPSFSERTEVEHNALCHKVVEQTPLLFVPISKELMTEIVYRSVAVIIPIRERHKRNTFKS